MRKIYVIYHANCYDGFTSAWAAYKALGRNAEYIPMGYDNIIDVDRFNKGSIIFFLDFSSRPEIMDELGDGRMVIILDHHKTAAENLEGYPRLTALFDWCAELPKLNLTCYTHLDSTMEMGYTKRVLKGCKGFEFISSPQGVIAEGVFKTFDMYKSGAMLAWEFFNDVPPPILVQYVQDKDLWHFKLHGSKEFNSYLRTFEFDFKVWDEVQRQTSSPDNFIENGKICLRQDKMTVDMIIKKSVLTNYDGLKIAYCNTSSHWSEVGHALLEKYPECDLALSFTLLPEHSSLMGSVRSSDDRADASEFVKQFGGGGHRNASGFNLDYLEGLDLLELLQNEYIKL